MTGPNSYDAPPKRKLKKGGAAKPLPPTNTLEGSGPRLRRKPVFDLGYYEHLYVTGPDTVSLLTLADLPQSPSHQTLKEYSRSNDWVGQRTLYRQETAGRARAMASTSQAEICARHIKMAQGLQAKALQRLQSMKLEELTAADVVRYIQAACEIERKAAGMDNEIVLRSIPDDLSKLTEAELITLAARAGITGNPKA